MARGHPNSGGVHGASFGPLFIFQTIYLDLQAYLQTKKPREKRIRSQT
jgi:hypothetical protein